MLPWLVQALHAKVHSTSKGMENHGWNHDTVKCAFMSCILNGSQKAYSYVSLLDFFHLFHHRSSPLPPSRLRMKRGSKRRIGLAMSVAQLLQSALGWQLAVLSQLMLNLGHQSEDWGATSSSRHAQQWNPDCVFI